MKTLSQKVLLLILFFTLLPLGYPNKSREKDPLPSWNEGKVKQEIISFVNEVTNSQSRNFVPPKERIAVFDNDGTLWCETPFVQGVFVFLRLQQLLPQHPEWKQEQPFKAALEMDREYIIKAGPKAFFKLMGVAHSGLTQDEYRSLAENFFENTQHPKFNVSYKQMVYQPMIELLKYLRNNNFRTYICSGGGIAFIRSISDEIYGIPPENVIGSSFVRELRQKDDKIVIYRHPEFNTINDREAKVLNIDLHIGRKPIFAAGNIRNGGDIAMLRYSQSQDRSTLQLLINHDDSDRESSYMEKDGASLNAAKKNNWIIVSMQRDFKRIFSFAK